MSVPVVDEARRLVGVITIDDIVDVIREEADDDLKALGGVSVSEELSDNVWWTTKSRFLWLFVNLFTAFLASGVLGLFEGQLQKMVALAVLGADRREPGRQCGDADHDGCGAGAGDAGIVAFQHAARDRPRNLVGALNGALFGVMTGLVARSGSASGDLGVVIALAMLTNLVAGALGGISDPAHARPRRHRSGGVLRRLRHDGDGCRRLWLVPGIATLWFGSLERSAAWILLPGPYH